MAKGDSSPDGFVSSFNNDPWSACFDIRNYINLPPQWLKRIKYQEIHNEIQARHHNKYVKHRYDTADYDNIIFISLILL